MTPQRRSSDEEQSRVSAKEFGAMQATLDATVTVLAKHLEECSAQNKEVARNVRNLTIAVAVLAFAVLGEQKVLAFVEKLFT